MKRLVAITIIITIVISTFNCAVYGRSNLSGVFKNIKVEYSSKLLKADREYISYLLEGIIDDGKLSDGIYSNNSEIETMGNAANLHDFEIIVPTVNTRDDDKVFNYVYVSMVKPNVYSFLTSSITYSKRSKKADYITNKMTLTFGNYKGQQRLSKYDFSFNDYKTVKAFRESKEGKGVSAYACSILGKTEGAMMAKYLCKYVYQQ